MYEITFVSKQKNMAMVRSQAHVRQVLYLVKIVGSLQTLKNEKETRINNGNWSG